MAEIVEFPGPRSATRISVSGNGRGYTVRVDGGRAFQVAMIRGEAHCECGSPRCVHVASLRACGFMDANAGESEEAIAA